MGGLCLPSQTQRSNRPSTRAGPACQTSSPARICSEIQVAALCPRKEPATSQSDYVPAGPSTSPPTRAATPSRTATHPATRSSTVGRTRTTSATSCRVVSWAAAPKPRTPAVPSGLCCTAPASSRRPPAALARAAATEWPSSVACGSSWRTMLETSRWISW